MNRSARDKFHGITLDEWIEGKINGLDVDALSLLFIPGLRIGFGLCGDELEQAVREVLEGLMARGARPIQGHSDDGGYWTRVTRFGDEPSQIVEGVIREWRASGRDPEIGDIWFASPEYIASECRP